MLRRLTSPVDYIRSLDKLCPINTRHSKKNTSCDHQATTMLPISSLKLRTAFGDFVDSYQHLAALWTALAKKSAAQDPWRSFSPGDWRSSIDVRDFIVRNSCPPRLRLQGVFRTSHRPNGVQRLRASLAPREIKHAELMAGRRVCRCHFEAAPQLDRLNLAALNLEHDASP